MRPGRGTHMNKATMLIGKRRRFTAALALGLAAAAWGWTLAPAARAANPIWINPLTCGQPIASYYLGDSLSSPWYVNFEIGQPSWNYAQVGYGTAANGTGYNWGVANWYEDGSGSNKRVRRNIGGLKFTATGSWYLICQANESGPDTYTSASACGWTDSTTYPPASMAYFTVNALNDPSGQDAAAVSASQIDLAWSKDAQGHNVMIVRKRSTDSWTEPTQGTAYSVGNAIGSGTVVYNGAGTAYENTGLSAGTTYDYKFYSENYSYYSAGVVDSATTPKLDQTIDFPAIGNQLSTNVVALSATATSGLDVEFAVGSGPASIAGTTLTFTGAGSVSIVASQPGNATYNAAPEVTNTFDVAEPELGILLNKAEVNVRENGEGRFVVRLTTAPTSSVWVTVSRVSGSDGITIQSGETRAFSAATWNVWQTVVLAAADDANAVGETATFRISAPGCDDVFVTATALDDDIGANLALASNGTTIAGKKRPALLIDGVHTVSTNYSWTIWTNVPADTITLDMQQAMIVSRIRLLNWDWVHRVQRYVLEASEDGTTWTTVADASGEDHSGWDDWAVADETARYLRFTGLTNSANECAVLSELEVYGVPGPLPPVEISKADVNVREDGEGRFYIRLSSAPTSSVWMTVSRVSGSESIAIQSGSTRAFSAATWNVWQAVTLAAGADENADGETATFRISAPGYEDAYVTATALDDDIGANLALASGGATVIGKKRPALLTDGVHTVSTNYSWTIWTNVPADTITLDMKRAMSVSRIRLLNWDWVYRVQRYVIEASEDGTTWTTVVDASGSDRAGWDDWAVAGEMARYLRFTGLFNSANECAVLSELEVYGTPGPLPPVEITKADVNVRESGEGRFYIRLSSAPTSSVWMTVSRVSGSESIAIQSGSTRAFSAATWNVWQAVTLAAGADENADGETATFRISAPGYEDAYVTATALDDDIGANLALASGGATVIGKKRPALLTDGVHTVSTNYSWTIWTNVPADTITLDMKRAMSVSRIRLLNWDWVYRVQRYVIEASEDGSSWTTVADASGSDRAGWDDWAVAGGPIRYLRFTGLFNSANECAVLSELEVYGTRPAGRRSLAAGTAGAAAAAPGATVVVESEPVAVLTSEGPADETGWNALDGDDATAWVGQKAGGGYLVVEYQPTLALSGLEVDVTEASLAAAQVLTSLDGQDWQPLPEDLEANPVALNFLWIVFPDDGTAAVPEVIEIRPNP